MPRIAYVNGRYVPQSQAAVHIEDRGYQFSDGVYEVVDVRHGKMIDEAPHMARLKRSLGELSIPWPMSPGAMKLVMAEVIRRNRLQDGFIYLQITRGVAPRDHGFPAVPPRPALVMTVRRLGEEARARGRDTGVSVVTIPEIRWARRDIKTVSLLPNVLGKETARQAGAYEAWMVEDDGRVTEGTSSNAWIVTKKGELITRHADHAILSGITRRAVLMVAEEEGLTFVERAFTVAEAKRAREAFLTSTTSHVKPVVRIDDHKVGKGIPGPVTRKLIAFYQKHVESQSA